MKFQHRIISSLAIFAIAVVGAIGLTVFVSAQGTAQRGSGLPEDWSHRHVVFTNPGTAAEALAQGRLEQWYRIVNEPRYQMQVKKRSLMQRQLAAAPDFAARMALLRAPDADRSPWDRPRTRKERVERDWSMNLGGGSAASQTGTVSGAATGGQTITITNGSNSITLTATPTAASATGTFSGEPASGGTVTITNGAAILVLTASTTTTTSCTLTGSTRNGSFQRSGTTGTDVTRFLTAINGTNCGSYVGLASATSSGDVVTITASTAGSAGDGITLADTMTNFAWSSSTLVGGADLGTTGKYFAPSSTVATEAANIVSAINTNGSTVGVSASTTGGGNVTVTATSAGAAGNSITLADTLSNFAWTSGTLAGGVQATVGAGQYPAKYSFDTTSASCSDYVVYNTGVPGSSGQATVVAYTNIYVGTCGSTVPTIEWAYNTGGTAALSPVLNWNGTQVAFIQTASSVASLVVLKMANSGGTAAGPATITSVANSAYPTCTAPCYTTIGLGANDTNSPPFYDYANDVMYVGDDSGNLHKFTYVFNGTSTNYLTSSWSTNVSSGDTNKYGSSGALSGPVLDFITGLIFVGDRYGYLHSVNSSGGSLLTSGQLGNVTAGGPGINDAPLIDTEGSTSNVYVFLQNTNSSVYTYINKFATGTALSTTSYGTALGISGVNGTQLLYDGTFDNQWYSSNGTAGNLYFCGVDSTHNAYPTLFQIPMPAFSAANTYATITNGAPMCSPLTEFYNGTTDYLYLSVTASGTATGCTGACMYSFILPSNTTTHSGTATAGLTVAGGASGTTIDNTASGGGSQIYFSTLAGQSCNGNGSTGSGTGGCAVQASQSGLN